MRLSMVTWNIRRGINLDGVLAFLKRINADVMFLQEVARNYPEDGAKGLDGVREIMKAFPGYDMTYAPILLKKEDGMERSWGNLIVSKHPLVESGAEYFHKKPDWSVDRRDNQARNILFGRIKIGKVDLEVGATHLTPSKGFEDTKRKMEEGRKIAELVRDRRPFVLAGDFNSTSDSLTVQEIMKVLPVRDGSGERTFAVRPFKWDEFSVEGLEYKLDGAFASKNVLIRDVTVPLEESSDHLPVVFTVVV